MVCNIAYTKSSICSNEQNVISYGLLLLNAEISLQFLEEV
jgi:hypothetical protein